MDSACPITSFIGAFWKLVNEPAPAAAIGAAGAVFAIVATDWLRDRRKARRQIPSRLELMRILVDERIAGVDASVQSMQAGTMMLNIGMRFNVDALIRLGLEGASHLSPEQQMAVENIAFRLKGADDANQRVIDAQATVPGGIGPMTRMHLTTERALLVDAGKIIDAYLAGTLTDRGGIRRNADS